MCGIAGIWNLDGAAVDRRLLEQMTNVLAHRGPDGSGVCLFNTRDSQSPAGSGGPENGESTYDLGLGHRRLAIIDLSTGDQPMATPDGSLWVTFCGEIYNYRELRADLKAKGYVFRTTSDTEVILNAYAEYGVDCPKHLSGIFAFALWDSRNRRLFLARDHYGIKPVYYCLSDGTFRFGSEIKSILADPSVNREVDVDALNLCLTFRHTPSPWTLFKGIYKLPPASCAVISSDGLRVQRYWDGEAERIEETTDAGLVEALAARLEQAVVRQMVSDVPVSLSLSSGVDSSTLLAIMSRHSSGPVRTFTVGFAGREEASEIPPAEFTARLFDAEFQSWLISEQDYSQFLNQYIWHLEEPVGNDSAPAYYFVAQMARAQGIKVMLNGQGPDEAFAGYGRHLGAAYGGWLPRIPGVLADRVVTPLADSLPLPDVSRRMAYTLSAVSEVDQLLATYSFLSPRVRERLFGPGLLATIQHDLPQTYLAEQLQRAPAGTRLERMLWVDARTSLPDNLLLCEDKMAMAASVEARVPFLDIELMALAEQVPGRLKLRRGRGKWIHREVCSRFVPAAVAGRPKIGFDNSLDVWLKARLGHDLDRLVRQPQSLTRSYLAPQVVHQLLAEHASGRRDHRRILFLLLSLEVWHSTFIEGATSAGAAA
jgi:asparagine synthase (glutamine-hydrolysing)